MTRRALLIEIIGIAYALTASAAHAATTIVAKPTAIRFADTTTITGTLTDAAGMPRAATLVQLQQNPYPYKGFVDAAHVTTVADGSFDFRDLKPDRNTRYRVVEPGGPPAAAPQVFVSVAPRATVGSRKISLGRVRLSLASTIRATSSGAASACSGT